MESIFDKFKENNISTLAVNGGNIFEFKFPTKPTWIEWTEGGSIDDFYIADWQGMKILLWEIKNYDFAHFLIMGMDHVSHTLGSPNDPKQNEISEIFDTYLKRIV